MKPLFCLLSLVFLIGLASVPLEEYRGDPMAMRCETVSLLNAGTLAIPSNVAIQFGQGETGQYFWHNSARDSYYSKYGFLNGFMYIPPLFVESCVEGELPYSSTHRVIYLNLYNVILSLATAAYLYFTVRKYTRSEAITWLFVLSAFYGTFWWNYLRAQNSEIFQTLFLLAFYYHLVSYFQPPGSGPALREKKLGNGRLILAGAFLGGLIMMKQVYVISLPFVFSVMFWYETSRARWRRETGSTPERWALERSLFWISLPLVLSLSLVLAVNAHEFGSPFESGYSQWLEFGKPVFSGDFFSGLCGFLFDPQYSIFLYFPILIFALFGYRKFLGKYPFDLALFLTIAMAMLLLQSKLLNWRGRWCYGPRYMLPVLPLLSLPFVQTLEFVVERWRSWWVMAWAGAMALILLYSLRLQIAVNSLPFFAFFDLQGVIAQCNVPEANDYFTSRPFGVINNDVIASKTGAPWRPLELVAPYLSPQQRANVVSHLQPYIYSNYYFWSGEPSSSATTLDSAQ